MAKYLHLKIPASPLFLVGFSLGGNIVLNLAADAAVKPLPMLAAVAAISPPVDLVWCSAMLARLPFYDRYYARNLHRQLRQHHMVYPDLPLPQFPRRLTMRLFDEIYTAPAGGFADALDYYRRASSLPLVPTIAVPTYILSARDDPYIPVEPLAGLQGHAHIQVDLVPKGGHLGFLGSDGAGGIRWGEQRTSAWIFSRLPFRR